MSLADKMNSPYPVATTMDRLQSVIAENSLITVIARVDQAELLRTAGTDIPPMEMLLFENRELARIIVEARPEAAFDLPIRAFAWEDESGRVWLRVTDPAVFSTTGASEDDQTGVTALITQILGSMLEVALGDAPL